MKLISATNLSDCEIVRPRVLRPKLNMDTKSCCCRKTCPRYQITPHDGSSSQKSSAPDYADKQTQKATDLSSELATSDRISQPAQSAASSEAHFNRNNENLNTPQPPPCPMCAVQFHQTGLHLYPRPACYPLCHHGPVTACLCPCGAHTTTSSAFEISTSSNSTTSEQLPIGLILNLRNIANKTPTQAEHIAVPWSSQRPERLQPCCCDDQQFETPTSPTTPTADDEYYSCGSASSDSDTISDSCNLASDNATLPKRSKKRSREVDRLLHKVVHLLAVDGTAGQAPSYTCEESTTLPSPQPPASAADLKLQIEQLQDLIDDFKNKLKICSSCSQLYTLIDKEKRSEDDLQLPSDQCPCPECKVPFNFVGHKNPSTANETLAEQDIGACTQKVKAEPPHSQFVPPALPCYCYCMAALAAAQGSVPVQYPPLTSPLNPVGKSQKEDEECSCELEQGDTKVEKLICICSKNKDIRFKPESVEAILLKEQEMLDEVDAGSTEEKLGPIAKMSTERFNPIHDNPEDEAVPFDDDKFAPSIPENKSKVETEDITEELHSHLLGLAPSQQKYDDEEPPYNVMPIETVGILYGSGQALDVAELPADNEEPVIEDVYVRLEENQCPGNMSGRDGGDEDLFSGSLGEEFDEEHELEKEKRAERQKSRCHKDPCMCCHCEAMRQSGPNQCMTLATTQQVPTGVEEFKYFVDSLIVDLDAMEQARRKCGVLKNLCASETPGVCVRESFPVTITDVQELGITSLYIKWTIHDCYGIGGYEIFVDGYLTNRYYHSGHTAGVVTDVDVSIPHKVALVAQPASMHDSSLELFCNSFQTKNKCKALPWKPDRKSSHQADAASLWTPSIYLYDPAHSQTLPALPILNDNI